MKYLLFAFLIFAITFSKPSAHAADPRGVEWFDMILYYLAKEPSIKSTKMPVLILLHGIGSNEKDLFHLADKLHPQMLIISARAPIQLDKGAYAWYQIDYSNNVRVVNMEQIEKSRLLLIQFIQQLMAKYPIDPSQVYLMGFSQGAIMSYSVALSEPTMIRGVLSLSGRILEEMKPKPSKREEVKRVAMFIGHGENDHVIDVEEGRAAAQYFRDMQLTVTYKEYPIRHEISLTEIVDINVWLSKIVNSK